MDKATFLEARAKLMAKVEKARETLTNLERALEGFDLAGKHVCESGGQGQSRGRHARVTAAVREAIIELKVFTEPFTVREAWTRIKAMNPNLEFGQSTVAAAIKQLVEEGAIQVSEQGKGRSPTKYRGSMEPERDRIRIAQ